MNIEKKDDGGIIYRDSQGNKIMESFTDGVHCRVVVEEFKEHRQQAHEEFPQLKPDGTVEGPLTITSGHIENSRHMSPEREGYTRFTAYSDEDEFDEEFPQLKPVKEFLDELTDEERRYLFTYYCPECGTKDVPCRCWYDT